MDQNVSLLIAFTAGFLSFIAPCVLPLVPSYLSYITGLTFKDLTGSGVKMTTVKHSLLFIAGFSAVFILLGAAASSLGNVLREYQSTLRWIGGIIIIFFGFYIIGLFKFKFLNKNIKFEFAKKPPGLFGSFLVGSGFAISWTACVGPILGTILFYAGSTGTVSHGVELLAAYSLGLGIPFFITSLALNSFLAASKKMRKYMHLIEIISGVFLIIVGILILTNYFVILSSTLQKLGIGWMRSN
ncbi:MAG TPA: cytochrome c biogenesis protein CcdA [Ignavibacteria bacterium]|nr:cytochrome c biogenesis protein CcdA [Ignavibacteria bacterium]